MSNVIVAIFVILHSVVPSNSSVQIRHAPMKSGLYVEQCLPWSYHDNSSHECECFSHVICSDNTGYLKTGYCATSGNGSEIFLVLCPYFQPDGFNLTSFDDHKWYVRLPSNLSELNDYFCGAMNRKGEVCSKCKDGFGPAILSIGFQIQCSKCIGVWYGIPLYLFLELFPITVFYLILLIFQINITSAPMITYILYSQLIIMAWDRIYSGDMPDLTGTMFAMSKTYKLFINTMLSLYDIWNLRFFRYLLPPFCISSKLKPLYISALGYVSVFYPLCLIILTWVGIELHGHNFKPIVWLWKPFHRCLYHLRKGWNTKTDIIDVFSSFFLLSFTKCLYQVLLFMTSQPILHTTLKDINLGSSVVLNIDTSISYGSVEHLVFGIPAIIISCIFNLLPTLILLFYPFELFRACLSKSKLDSLALYTFVEKFYRCYRKGLDGGKDMRSFASLHFVVRAMLLGVSMIGGVLLISNNDPYFGRNALFTSVLVLVALCQPYQEMYMNVLDVLLLAHLGLFCHLLSSFEGFEVHSRFVFTFSAMFSFPLIGFILAITIIALQKITKRPTVIAFAQRVKKLFVHIPAEKEHVLVDNIVAERNYGAIH